MSKYIRVLASLMMSGDTDRDIKDQKLVEEKDTIRWGNAKYVFFSGQGVPR